MVLKELIFNSFYFWRDVMVLKELIFNSFYFWKGMLVLKEVIFNSFFGRELGHYILLSGGL